MLTAARAFQLNALSEPELPHIPELFDMYQMGIKPRQGHLIMVAGRPGHQKSGFVLWWVAKMGLPTLYLSGDMSPFEASSRLAATVTGQTQDEVERGMGNPATAQEYAEALKPLPIQFQFSTPISWRGIAEELDAWVELHDSFPSVIVVDNLMDLEGCDSAYEGQMAAMIELSAISRMTKATVIVTHHATEGSGADPFMPPARAEIKNKVGEKPQLTLGVALHPAPLSEFRIAPLKQRNGPQDPTGKNLYVRLDADPARTQFHRHTRRLGGV